MQKQADFMESLNGLLDKGKGALSQLAPGELGWGAVGAGGGAMLGYALSRLLHRKPNARTKLLYALLGAAGGATGSHYLLKNLPAANGEGSKLDEIRDSAATGKPDPVDPADLPSSNKPGWIRPRNSALAAALVGAYRGGRLGGAKGGLLNPNAYETYRKLTGTDMATLERRLRARDINDLRTDLRLSAGTPAEDVNKAWLRSVGNRFGGYGATTDVNGRITLADDLPNAKRMAANAVAGAAIHGGAALGAHALLNAAMRSWSQDIDASNAAVTRDQLIRKLQGK